MRRRVREDEEPRFRPVVELVRLLPGASRPLTYGFAATLLVSGAAVTALMIAIGFVVAAVPGAVENGLWSAEGRKLLLALAGLAAAAFVMELSGPLLWTISVALGRRVENRVRLDAMATVLEPDGVAALHDPVVRDRLEGVRELHRGPLPPRAAVIALRAAGQEVVAGATCAIVLVAFRWWAAIVLALAWLVVSTADRRRLRAATTAQEDARSGLRRASYYRDLAIEAGAAKELRVFGLAGWIGQRMHSQWKAAIEPLWRARRVDPAILAASAVAVGLAYTAVFAALASAAAHGEISLGEVTVYVQTALGVSMLFPVRAIPALQRAAAAIPERHALAAAAAAHRIESGSAVADGMPRDAIRVEGVAFRYPGAETPVFEELDLTIPAGASLAIVGPNGAGKTTLVKLLTRLYDPSAGRITVDGVEVRELDLASWRRATAAIFQDFVHYPLGARDNIGFGSLASIDRSDLLERAAARAQASSVLDGLPDRWETPLAAEFGGVDLSGGQWQRIALARAFFAVEGGARVLMMDEPTANLDVRAEAELFERFLAATQGLTTILVSHRFSTVRRASRIVVLEDGRVLEQGSHDELMAEGGRYATMFRLQAAAYHDRGDGSA